MADNQYDNSQSTGEQNSGFQQQPGNDRSNPGDEIRSTGGQQSDMQQDDIDDMDEETDLAVLGQAEEPAEGGRDQQDVEARSAFGNQEQGGGQYDQQR